MKKQLFHRSREKSTKRRSFCLFFAFQFVNNFMLFFVSYSFTSTDMVQRVYLKLFHLALQLFVGEVKKQCLIIHRGRETDRMNKVSLFYLRWKTLRISQLWQSTFFDIFCSRTQNYSSLLRLITKSTLSKNFHLIHSLWKIIARRQRSGWGNARLNTLKAIWRLNSIKYFCVERERRRNSTHEVGSP